MDYQYSNPGYTPAPPQDYKVWSIVNIILNVLCCGCCGIIGLVFAVMALLKSNEISNLVAMGEEGMAQAEELSNKAKTFNIVASVLGGLSFILNIIMLIVQIANS